MQLNKTTTIIEMPDTTLAIDRAYLIGKKLNVTYFDLVGGKAILKNFIKEMEPENNTNEWVYRKKSKMTRFAKSKEDLKNDLLITNYPHYFERTTGTI